MEDFSGLRGVGKTFNKKLAYVEMLTNEIKTITKIFFWSEKMKHWRCKHSKKWFVLPYPWVDKDKAIVIKREKGGHLGYMVACQTETVTLGIYFALTHGWSWEEGEQEEQMYFYCLYYFLGVMLLDYISHLQPHPQNSL